MSSGWFLAVNVAQAEEALSGPTSVEATLQPAGPLNNPEFRSTFLRDTLSPWFEAKERLKRDYHLALGMDYSIVGAVSSAEMSRGSAIGHDLRFYGKWMPVNPNARNSGSLVFKFENRSAYSQVAPQDFGISLGAYTINAAQFSDADWIVTNLYWKQKLFDDRVTIGFGHVDVTDYTDIYPLANPLTGFSNLAFSVSPAIAAPNQGLGVAAGIWFSDNVYAIAGIADANGNQQLSSDVFSSRETFKHFEIGFTTSRERQFLDNFHVTFWQQDARTEARVPEDWGVSASINWVFNNTWSPFLRAGWAEGGAAVYETSVSAGIGYLTRQQDLLGIGLNWSRPGGSADLNAQWTLEAFYKYQLSQTLALTLDTQFVIDPCMNSDEDTINITSLRFRGAF